LTTPETDKFSIGIKHHDGVVNLRALIDDWQARSAFMLREDARRSREKCHCRPGAFDEFATV
jgi:hypothetical protein